MEDLNSRMGYLRGLSEGLGINDDTKEGKIIRQLISFLDDIVESVQSMQEDYDELFSYVEAIDEDLTDLENGFFEDDDDDEDYEDDDDYEEDDDYDVSFTVECPECRQEVAIDEDILEDEESLEVLCPNCGRVVFINDEEWEEELEEDGDEK
jgi:DNA-directed RNA polymerase subunit delta